MEPSLIVERIQNLSDLELAVLLCLIAKQHCIIETTEEQIDDVAEELALISSRLFGLSHAVLSCDEYWTIEDFGEAVLDQDSDSSAEANESELGKHGAKHSYRSPLADVDVRAGPTLQLPEAHLDNRKVVNVVIAKNFNRANEDVQIQGLELIRRRRLYSRTTIHPAPETCLLISLITAGRSEARLNKHLNDRIFISHYHDPEDGLLNLEELETGYDSDDQGSTSSIARKTNSKRQHKDVHALDMEMIEYLRHQSDLVTITPEVRAYLQNIVVFLRLERGVIGGVSPYATTLFEALTKYLALLHGLDYVTPSMVALAARKIYPHRIMIAVPEKERSMQYGSDLEAVKQLLDGVTSETVVEAVLNRVGCPL